MLRDYEANLRAAVEVLRARGLTVLLSTVVANLETPPYRDCPGSTRPEATWHVIDAFLDGQTGEVH